MPIEQTPLPVRAVTRGPKHHWFGYYDKFPWDSTGRYLLGLESDFMDRPPKPGDKATLGLIDLQDDCAWRPLDSTEAWNWQQGTMLHWLPTAPDRLLLYNAREGDRYIAIVRDAFTGKVVRKLPRAVYAMSRDGKQAVTLNFARLHRHRPGYGYDGAPDESLNDLAPENVGIWHVDMESGADRLPVSIRRIVEHQPDETMDGVSHWVNHLQFNADGSRFVFLHRWRPKGQQWWHTRMFTANPDGSDLYCLNGKPMTSHFDWRDETHILAWANRSPIGNRYFLFRDRTQEAAIVGADVFSTDGHCSYSPDGRWVLTDTYPDKEQKRTLILYNVAENRRLDVGRFLSPPVLTEIRCDLHPRWSRDGRQVCFDSVHEGSRQMYVMDVSGIVG